MQLFSGLIISETEFYITISVVTLVLLFNQLILNFIKKDKIKSESGSIKSVLFTRLIGFILFGIIPVSIIYFFSDNTIDSFGIQINNITQLLWWIIPLLPILFIVTYLNSKQKEHLSAYPQIRKTIWSPQLLFLSMSGWILYLLAYEFLFRGYLLVVSISFLGIWPAIIINTIFYSVAHIPKGTKETVMAIPFGLVLCFSVIHTGNMWVAFILHGILALSNEWFSLKANPEMKLIKKEQL